MSGYDIWLSLFLTLCSLGIIHTSRNLPPPLSGTVGSGYWPGFLGYALLSLSVALGATALWRRRKAKHVGSGNEDGVDAAPPIDYRSSGMRKVYALCGIFLAFCGVLHFVGFTVAAMFIAFSCAWLVGERRWWTLLLIAVCIPVGMIALFVHILRLPLP